MNDNLNFLRTGFNIKLNGSYSIKTKKDFSIESIDFVSDGSILNFKNNEGKKNLKSSLNGSFSWEKKKNILKFFDITLGNQLAASGKIDLISQKGYLNFFIQKISVEDSKNYLNEFSNYYHLPADVNWNKISNKFRGGNLANFNINVKFSLFQDFVVEEIVGSSLFIDTRFEYNDKFFKKLFSTISGDFDFKLKPQKLDDNMFNVNINARNGFLLVNNFIQHRFS